MLIKSKIYLAGIFTLFTFFNSSLLCHALTENDVKALVLKTYKELLHEDPELAAAFKEEYFKGVESGEIEKSSPAQVKDEPVNSLTR